MVSKEIPIKHHMGKTQKLLNQFKIISSLFTKKQRRGFQLLILIMIINSIFEMLGVGAISPLLSLAVDESNTSSTSIRIISQITGFSGKELFYFIGIGFIFLTVVKNTFSFLTYLSRSMFYTRLNKSFSSRLVNNYLAKDFVWFLNRNTSDFPRLIIDEVQQISQKVINSILIIFSNLFLTLGLLIVLGIQNWLMAIIIFTFLGGLYYILYIVFKNRLKFLGKKRFALNKDRFILLNNMFSGIKEVKVRDKERFFLNRFIENARNIARNTVRQDAYTVLPRYTVETVVFCLFGFLLIFIKSHDSRLIEHLPTITLYAFAGYRLLPSLQQISRSMNAVVSGVESLKNLRSELVHDDQLPAVNNRITLGKTLELKNIKYIYPEQERQIFHDFNLTIKSKEKLGIVGFSGSGKTTLLNLLIGLLFPQQGYLKIDDTIIDQNNVSGWRHNLGLVSQDVYLLDGTIAENIAFGINTAGIDQEKLITCARAAEIHSTILSLPNGYETEVGERGIRLSGGQAQRIVIARALYHDPDVLIFDEATSAMDNLTEKAIMDSIERLSGEKTIIIVAHRLSTVKDCDRIILLKDGQILNQGTYEDLLEHDQNFRRLAMENDTEE